MIKGVLIDLGKTILTNESFSFEKGLVSIFDNFQVIRKNNTLDKYLKVCNKYMYLYQERDITHLEIPFTKYISLVLNELHVINYNPDELEDCFLKNAINDNVIQNVTTFLDYLNNNNIPIIIVSNSTISSRALLNELKQLNIDHYFNELISSSDILFRKPSTKIFDYSYKRICEYIDNPSKKDVVFIGNDYNLDVLGSLKAGLTPLFYNVNNEDHLDCIYSFNNYLKLIEYLKRG